MEIENIRRIFENEYEKFVKAIFRYIYFKVSDYDLAQDLTSETFLKYWKVLKQKKEVENSKALLYFIAKGLVVDFYRKKGTGKQVSLEKIDERLLISQDDMEEAITKKQEVQKIYVKMNELKKEYKEVLLLHYVEDLTLSEISFILKKRENTVRVLVHRALKSLKTKL